MINKSFEIYSLAAMDNQPPGFLAYFYTGQSLQHFGLFIIPLSLFTDFAWLISLYALGTLEEVFQLHRHGDPHG
jgi:hypothetical protein